MQDKATRVTRSWFEYRELCILGRPYSPGLDIIGHLGFISSNQSVDYLGILRDGAAMLTGSKIQIMQRLGKA